MINNNLSTKAYILERLRKTPGAFVSGTKMGEALGISRVAVWKAVKILESLGYPIEDNDKGYRLPDPEAGDFLYPWEFGEKEPMFRHWPSTDSTMNRAKELADRGVSGDTVITAETQTAGRGRHGKSWSSEKGGLFFTLIKRPQTAIAAYSWMTLAVHVAAAKAISRVCGKQALLRWPNDIYINGKKIAGLLSELQGEGDMLAWITLGLGININNPCTAADSINCKKLAGHPVSRREALLAILDELEKLQPLKNKPQELCALWNQYAEGIGGPVAVVDPQDKASPYQKGHRKTTKKFEDKILGKGAFLGINPQGQGLVKTDAGVAAYIPGLASFVF